MTNEQAPAPTDAVIARSQSTYDLVVFGKDSESILAGREALLEWAKRKLNDERDELIDLGANLAIAIQRNWNTEPWERRVYKQKKRIEYYEKIAGALEAGYVLMPTIPMDIIAVRTRKNAPQRERLPGRIEDLRLRHREREIDRGKRVRFRVRPFIRARRECSFLICWYVDTKAL